MKLLLEHKASVAVPEGDQFLIHQVWSAVYFACNRGYLEIVKLMLEYKSSVDEFDRDSKDSLLMTACSRGNTSVVEVLLEHKASVNNTNKYGSTALHAASSYGKLDCVRLLLQHNAKVDVVEKELGESPLHRCCSNGHLEITKTLLEHKAAVDIKDRKGNTAFDVIKNMPQGATLEIAKYFLANQKA